MPRMQPKMAGYLTHLNTGLRTYAQSKNHPKQRRHCARQL